MTEFGPESLAETGPPRAGQELPLAQLAAWMGAPVPAKQFLGGHSNLTYLLEVGGQEIVLRRAPPGPLPPKAHDMVREFRVLEALHPHFPAAPRPLRLCEDPAVLGAPFYLMERRYGVIVRRARALAAASATGASRAFIDCLAELHAIFLPGLGKPDGFLERQLAGWSERWRLAATPDQPALERVIG